MINLEQKGEWGVYFFDIDHVLIYSATIELTPKKYTRNPSIIPGKKINWLQNQELSLNIILRKQG